MWDLIVSVPDHCLSFYFMCDAVSYRYSFVQIHAGQLSVTGESMGFQYWLTA